MLKLIDSTAPIPVQRVPFGRLFILAAQLHDPTTTLYISADAPHEPVHVGVYAVDAGSDLSGEHPNHRIELAWGTPVIMVNLVDATIRRVPV